MNSRAKMLHALSMITPNRQTGGPDDFSAAAGPNTFTNSHRPSEPSEEQSSSGFPRCNISLDMILNHYGGSSDEEADGLNNINEQDDDDRLTCDDIQTVLNRANSVAASRNEEGALESELDNENDESEVILSLFWKGSKLGAAVYKAETTEVLVLADIPDLAPFFNVTKSFVNQIMPTQIVTCARLTESFVNTLKEYCGSNKDDDPDESTKTNCRLQLVSSTEYKHKTIKSRILALRLPCEPEASLQDDDSHANYIHSLVDLNNDCSVYALGGLLKYMDKTWGSLNLELMDHTAPIVALKRISLSEMVSIDLDTIIALQIFSSHINPNNVGKAKSTVVSEGLSLFALFNRCKSTMGCKFLRMMMLKPTNNFEVLNSRLDVIEFCNATANKEFLHQILSHMRNVKGVLRILTKLKAAKPTVKDWKSLLKTIYHVVAIGEMCGAKPEVVIFQKIHNCLTEDLYRIGQSINTIMDMEESEEANRFIVRPGIDSNLDKKKQEYNGMKKLLFSVAQQELADLPETISQCSVNYVPELGYMLVVPVWLENLGEQEAQLPNMQLLFISNQHAHYKTARCKELDKVLGDILLVIMEKEMEIMVKLIQFVEKKIHCIDGIMDLLAEFDALAAMAAASAENEFVRPILTEDRVLDIKEGKHPLQEHCVSEYVPNDVFATENEKRVKVLTGPNACGKSIYLKQVAIIVYMAHLGCFVPAESAKIGLVSEIFTRIQTVESVSMQLSSFMVDLRQMALALQRSSPRSLLVIDEFGKGTSELDGLALLAASLNQLLQRRQECPLVFLATHFHSVTDLLADRDSHLLHKLTLEHLCNDKEVIYLYKLKDGGVSSSFAHQVAVATGIDASVMSRARDVMDAMVLNKLPKEMPLSPTKIWQSSKNNSDPEDIDRQRRNFVRYMKMTDEEIDNSDPNDYIEMIFNL